jgi:hypothetical protein
MSLGEVAEVLQEDYEIDEAGAWQNVSEFVAHLRDKKLLVEAPSPAASADEASEPEP